MDIVTTPSIKTNEYNGAGTPPIKKIDTRMELPNREQQGHTKGHTTYTEDLKSKSHPEKSSGNIIDIYA